ncbi:MULTISPECIES: enoyl-CoA hydratase-related protein [unclassified Microbacterium]|uniref:enoyl-CoA hydratase-related protein n=1 Tax=unclassified Microbacterium TaxID=2609290 RepID=UPI00214C9C66|nr:MULTISPECIES: enoyl-CoA hydratase-related protein [unclassified Microbacterium]MCR2811378.1 enoyl-CoA hydratase-related protein [Microbacterium sp. zg.B185]WIM19576.1 enoyl-CoA hydratase-related protein [Microbacterium sp. zg-B185]
MTAPSTDVTVSEARPGVFLIRIDRPERRNALNIAIKQAVADAVIELDQDPRAKAIVISGGPEYFVAGTDVAEMVSLTPTAHTVQVTDAMFTALRRCQTPLLAAIEGYALGGGMELALSCDLIIAGENAKLGQPEILVGVIPGAGGTQRLVRVLGKYRALSLLLTGAQISGREAFELGLISEVVPDTEATERSLAVATALVGMPPLAVQAILEVVDIGADLPLEGALLLERKAFQLLFDSTDQTEGMTAFLEKRRPKYTGR